jgi:hypothetical protein
MRSGPNPGKVQLWSQRFSRFEKSSQRVAEFCAAEGISQPSFYAWKRKLGVSSNGQSRSSRAKSAPKAPRRHAFQRLQVTTSAGGLSGGVTMRLPGGIEVFLGSDLPTIEQVVDQLLDRVCGGSSSC